MSQNYEGLFTKWEIGTAQRLIREFQRQWTCLSKEDFDDLLQECLSHWHFSKNYHDPKGEASQRTFMVRIIRNKLTDLIRKRESGKRRIALLTVSLNAPTEVDEDFQPSHHIVSECFTSDGLVDPCVQIDLRIDLESAMRRLTPRQVKLCHLLGEEGCSIREAGKHLHISRTTLRDEIKRIRKIFRTESLEEYMKPSPAISWKSYVCTR